MILRNQHFRDISDIHGIKIVDVFITTNIFQVLVFEYTVSVGILNFVQIIKTGVLPLWLSKKFPHELKK